MTERSELRSEKKINTFASEFYLQSESVVVLRFLGRSLAKSYFFSVPNIKNDKNSPAQELWKREGSSAKKFLSGSADSSSDSDSSSKF